MPFTNTVLQTDPYTPNGITTNFPFFFQALSDAELQVVLIDSLGVETVVSPASYDVYNIGEPGGGLVVFPTAPLYTNKVLRVRSVPSYTQEFDFENQGAYNPSDLNRALDRDAQRAIHLRDMIANGVGGGVGTSGPIDWLAVQNKPVVFPPAAHTHDAVDIVTGLLATARIPNLDAGKVTTGAFDIARIPTLDASKVTTGVFDPARIPPGSTGVVSSGNIAALTAPQQAIIVEGTLVTTTDGQRWVYSGTGSKVLEASYVNIGSSTADWSTLSSKPPNVTSFGALVGAADKIAYFNGVGSLALANFTATGRTLVALTSTPSLQALASPLTTKGDIATYTASPARLGVGVDGQFLTADSTVATGLRWSTLSSSAGVQNMPNFVTVFSGNGDGVTNNDAALAAAEASAYERIWLPEGKYVTSRVSYKDFNKRFEGPGTLVRSAAGNSRTINNFSKYVDTVRTVNDEYGQAANTQFANVELKWLPPTTRHHFVKNPNNLYPYFYAPAVPHFMEFNNEGGSSGFAGLTSSVITAGVTTTVSIVGGTVGWTAGDTVGLTQSTTLDGTILETAIIQSVNTGAGTITFTTAPVNGYASGSAVSFGCRTMQAAYMVVNNHKGGGDNYAYLARVIVDKPMLASQTSFEHGATGGIIGGDMVAVRDGNYLTGWECQYSDNGADIAAVGRVDSYIRTNNGRLRNVFWVHDMAKMDAPTVGNSLKPIDVVYSCLMYAECGLDMSRSWFGNQRAIVLGRGHRIYFDGYATTGGPANAAGYIPEGGTTWVDVNGSGQLELYNGATSMTFLPGVGVQLVGALSATGAITGATLTSNSGLSVQSGSATIAGHVDIGGYYKVGGTPVVVARLGSIPDTTLDTSTMGATINSILTALRLHGLITGAGNP